MCVGFKGAVFDEPGQSQDQGVAGLDQIGGPAAQASFQFGVHFIELPAQLILAILGVLVLEGRFDAGRQLAMADRQAEVIVGARE